MKETYERPAMEVLQPEKDDIITSSLCNVVDGSDG